MSGYDRLLTVSVVLYPKHSNALLTVTHYVIIHGNVRARGPVIGNGTICIRIFEYRSRQPTPARRIRLTTAFP